MTATRLRLVDEAKKNTRAKRPEEPMQPNEAVASPASKRQAVRGPGAQSEVVERAAPTSAARPSAKATKRQSTVADVMRSPAVCCCLGDTLQRAAQLMWEHDVGAVVVVTDQGKPRHVLTDRDVCIGAYTQGVPLWASDVSSVGPAPVVSCSRDAGVVEVRRLMQEHGVRRIPVVDDTGVVVGVVGLGDLVREAMATLPKGRARGLTTAQLAQTLVSVYDDVAPPLERQRGR